MPKFEREVEIDAPVETVWEVMVNPNHWPQWFPGVESVSNVTSISEGGTFEWSDEGRTGRGAIVKMEPMERLEIMTQMGDDNDRAHQSHDDTCEIDAAHQIHTQQQAG